MLTAIVCPNCSEQGKIPDKFLNVRIKCKKCGKAFVANASPPEKEAAPAVAAPALPPVTVRKPGDIEVEGLEESAWTLAHESPSEVISTHQDPEPKRFAELAHADPSASSTDRKVYKLITTKDPYFKGKFELGNLEGALIHYAAQGWIVRSMGHPTLQGFSGGPKEELIIILER